MERLLLHWGFLGLQNDFAGGGFFYSLQLGPVAPGGYSIGSLQSLPILGVMNAPASFATPPGVAAPPPGSHFFPGAPSGNWFDPATADAYEFSMTGDSLFTKILSLPVGIDSDDLFSVSVGDTILGSFAAGAAIDFETLTGGGVSAFRVSGIAPPRDPEDPLAFPIQLEFSTALADFAMTPVPEPSTGLLLLAGLSALGWRRSRIS